MIDLSPHLHWQWVMQYLKVWLCARQKEMAEVKLVEGRNKKKGGRERQRKMRRYSDRNEEGSEDFRR